MIGLKIMSLRVKVSPLQVFRRKVKGKSKSLHP